MTLLMSKVTIKRLERAVTNQNYVEIALLNYPNSMISAIYGLSDLFRIANTMARQHQGLRRPLIRVSHWKAQESGEVTCESDTHPDLPHKPVYIILPGSMIEPVPEQATAPISQWLVRHHHQGTTICSVCAGSFVLASAGLLDHREATTHWFFADAMAKRFPLTTLKPDKMIIDDGDIITAGGIMAWQDLGLRLVHRILGPTLMLETARFLLIDPSSREQRFYSVFSPPLYHGDEQILKVQHWLQINGGKDVTLTQMAKKAGMGSRTFIRRFHKATEMNPTEYCQNLKISKGREMLELTHQTVDQIAWAVGYEDPGAFRKIFQKIIGLTPSEYRTRFGVPVVA